MNDRVRFLREVDFGLFSVLERAEGTVVDWDAPSGHVSVVLDAPYLSGIGVDVLRVSVTWNVLRGVSASGLVARGYCQFCTHPLPVHDRERRIRPDGSIGGPLMKTACRWCVCRRYES